MQYLDQCHIHSSSTASLWVMASETQDLNTYTDTHRASRYIADSLLSQYRKELRVSQ